MANVLDEHNVCPPTSDEPGRLVVYECGGPPYRFGNDVLAFLGTSRGEIDGVVDRVRDLGESTVHEAMYHTSQALLEAQHIGVRALSLVLG